MIITLGGNDASTIAEALASAGESFHFHRQHLTIAKHAAQIAECLRQVAAGLLLNADLTNGEKAYLGKRQPLAEPLQALSKGHVTRCCSTTLLNSLASGSGLSRAITCRHSLSGKPDLTPRTMTIHGVGQPRESFCCCCAVILLMTQRGMPKAPRKAATPAPTAGNP